MSFSWEELGLAKVWIDGDESTVLYDVEHRAVLSDEDAAPGLLRLRFPDAARRFTDDDRTVNLRTLARALLPGQAEHRVGAIADALEIPVTASEPERFARILEGLLHEAEGLDRQALALLAQVLPEPTAGLLNHLLLLPVPEQSAPEEAAGDGEAGNSVSVESLDEAFAMDGPIGRAFGTFEVRSGQLKMAYAVEKALRDGEAALVEAGPGTGKTFAYLIPALLHLKANPSDRIMISTRTRQLQEQLYGEDLPFLIRHLAPDLDIALLKGRENYLCFRRWQALIGELTESLERDALLPSLAPLIRWLSETETGDIEENNAFQSDPESRALWPRLYDSAHHCTGLFCPYGEECFSVQARRRARKADLVVVNHSLLLSDLAVDNVILGKYTHLVVDEAHTLEAVARAAFTRRLTERSFLRLADDLAPTARRNRGWLNRTPFVGATDARQRVEDLLSKLRILTGTAFRQFAENLPDERRAAFNALTELSEEIGESPILLTQLEDALDRLSDHLEEDEPLKELEGYIRTVQALRETVEALSSPPSDNTVHWYERATRALVFQATPLDVAPFLEKLLYPRLKALVLTSATLSLGGDFDFLCRSIGLSDEAFPLQPLIAESPFEYEQRMRIVVPRFLPPAHGELEPYTQALAELIGGLSQRLGRKGLALFTSYAMMQAVQREMRDDPPTLVQGDVSRTALIERFKRSPSPIWLLGTESFWEGVDFPGDELEIVLVTRLPFPVPTDPVLAAMGERLSRLGRDPFVDLSIPLAGLKLRQGVGRLIRTIGDHGLVLLTDQRIVTRGYGRLFARSLPVPVDVVTSEAALLDDAAEWFNRAP